MPGRPSDNSPNPARCHLDAHTIVAVLLHHVVEDCGVSLEELGEVADPTYLVNFLRDRWGESAELALGEAIETRIEDERLISIYGLKANQDLIDFAYEQGQLSEEELRAQFKEYLGQQLCRMEEELERIDNLLERRRRLAGLPDDAELNRILKYQSRTDNGLFKSLHELQRLQTDRQGRHFLLPAALDVTVDIDASTSDEAIGVAVAAPDDEQRNGGEDSNGKMRAVESLSVTLKDYLGDAGVARLHAQRDVRQVRDGDGEEPLAAD